MIIQYYQPPPIVQSEPQHPIPDAKPYPQVSMNSEYVRLGDTLETKTTLMYSSFTHALFYCIDNPHRLAYLFEPLTGKWNDVPCELIIRSGDEKYHAK